MLLAKEHERTTAAYVDRLALRLRRSAASDQSEMWGVRRRQCREELLRLNQLLLLALHSEYRAHWSATRA